MMNFNYIVIPLYISVCAVPASAQVTSTPEKFGIITFTEPYNDPDDITAASLAKDENISIQESRRRLKLMDKVAQIAYKLEKKYPNNFGGVSVIHKPFLQARFSISGRVGRDILDEIRTFTSDSELLSIVGAGPAIRSRKESKALSYSIFSKMNSLGIKGDVAVDYTSGHFKLLVRDPDAAYSAINSGNLLVPDGTSVEKFSGIHDTATLFPGGIYFNSNSGSTCTTGFNVTAPSGRGVTTAGHCFNNANADRIDTVSGTYFSSPSAVNMLVRFVYQWIGNGVDVQYHVPIFPSETGVNTRFQSDFGVYTTLTGGRLDYSGSYVCKFGRTTRKTCGYIDPYQYTTADGDFPRINRNASYAVMVGGGDSGGPVYTGSLAIGMVKGMDANMNVYYTSLRAWDANNLAIQIICTC